MHTPSFCARLEGYLPLFKWYLHLFHSIVHSVIRLLTKGKLLTFLTFKPYFTRDYLLITVPLRAVTPTY